jgi:hypothetical protein
MEEKALRFSIDSELARGQHMLNLSRSTPSFRQSVALILAVSYLCVAVLGALCLFGVAPIGAGTHHHHAGATAKAGHSPLCAWACQAGSLALLIGVAGSPFALFLLWRAVISVSSCFTQIAWAAIRPRSPPLPVR